MADISKIKLPGDSTTYDIKDANTRHIKTYYNTNGSNSGKYYKISINSYTDWMLLISVQLYHAYKPFDLQISGYNYGSSHWYSPTVQVLGSSTDNITVTFGYTQNYHLWFAIPAEQYTGLTVSLKANGYYQVSDEKELFTIEMVDGKPSTVQTEITAYRPYKLNDSLVTGVKGSEESSYKTGNVNLTANQVGAIPKNTYGNTQFLRRPSKLQGANDVTLDSKINTLRANRLAFLPADQIIIEKTIDGGTTWADAGVPDSTKVGLFSETRANVTLPQIDGKKSPLCGLRFTITAMKYNVPSGTAETSKYNYWNSNYIVSTERYNQLKEMYFWVSVSGGALNVKVERATGAKPNDWVVAFDDPTFNMTGYSGNDYISFSQGVFGGGTTQTSNYWNYRITIMTDDALPSGNYLNYTQSIMEIRAYGDTWWTAGNEYAANDKMYTHDYLKNVSFPAKVSATGGFDGNLTGNVTGTATTATRLEIQSNVTGSTADSFRGSYLRYARILNLEGTGLTGDGVIIWIPWSDAYGRQLIVEEASGHTIYSRYYNNGTWSGWRDISYRWDCAPLLYGGVDTGLGSGTPASNAKAYYSDTSKVPSNSIKSFYNTNGVEYSILFSNRGNCGSILKWGYNDKYLRILRMYGGNWKSEDWEKMDAGNADTVNGKTVDASVPSNAKFTDTTYTGTSPITVSNANAIGINTASTSAYGATKLSTSTSSTATDVAATPSAVKTAYDLANTANGVANTALSGVNGNLIYDHTYTISNGVATFTPHVYQKGTEVTTNYAASCFTWKYRLIDGSEVSLTTKSNRGCDVTITNLGYGGHVIGLFTPA